MKYIWRIENWNGIGPYGGIYYSNDIKVKAKDLLSEHCTYNGHPGPGNDKGKEKG